MDTTAIIQFIGIVLFTSSVPNDPGIHAILPRIGHEVRVSPGDVHMHPEPVEGVENHVAAILYRDADVLTDSGTWAGRRNLKNGWKFVILDGEQVQFLTNGNNGTPPGIPAEIPMAASPSASCLTAASATRPTLRDAFQSPNYKGASAVVDIPFGKLDVCATNSNRVDTSLLMQTDGVLFIAAKKTTELVAKTIALKGDAVVYVVNVPPHHLLTGIEQPAAGEPHLNAYIAMLDTPCPSRPEPPAVSKVCSLSALREAYRMARVDPPTELKLINSECSNTQWP